MGSSKSVCEGATSKCSSATLLRRNSSSFHSFQFLRKEHIYKRWKFHTEEKALKKFKILEERIGKCPYVLNASQVKYMVGENNDYYVNALVQYPTHNLKEEIQERKKYFRTFEESVLWKCLEELTKALIFIRQNDSTYFPQSLSQIFFTQDGFFKIKDPEILPSLKECHHVFEKEPNESKRISEIIISMGVLSSNKKISFPDFNKINLYYSTRLATLLNKMFERKLTLKNILDEIKNENRSITFQLRKSFSPVKEQKQQKIIKINQSQKQNIPTFNNTKKIDPSVHSFPKNVKMLRKTCASIEESISPKTSLPLEVRKEENVEQKNLQFTQKTTGVNSHLFSQDESSIIESIIEDEESIVLKESSPVSALVDELDNITSDFMKLQNYFGRFEKSQEHIVQNSIIFQVSEEHETESDLNNSTKQITEQSFLTNNGKPIFVVEEYERGSKYEGYMVNGQRDGFGKFFYEDGGSYEGQWKKGEIEGYGKLYYQSNILAYEGYWKKGEFFGKGKIFNQNPDKIIGSFNYQDFTYIGTFWISYDGDFKNDHKNGKGTLLLSNGQKFIADWKDNNVEGEGVFYTKQGKEIRGVWENNILKKMH